MPKTISQIYTHYKIMPSLQAHQLRVAAVAQLICEASTATFNSNAVIVACLLHDMGNILKSNLTVFPQFCQPEGLVYWEAVKKEFQAKYGDNEHDAALAIAKELKIGAAAMGCLNAIGFAKTIGHAEHPQLRNLICCYSDMRVGPHGVLPLADRLQDLRVRYAGRHKDPAAAAATFNTRVHALEKIESIIFAKSRIRPTDITDKSIAAGVEKLKGFIL